MTVARFAPVIVAALAISELASCNRAASNEEVSHGKAVFELCASCHGPNGQGNRELGAPALAGLDAWYVSSQLRKFRSGQRGAHPDDVSGQRMRPIALSLERDDDLVAVSEYIALMSPELDPAPAIEGDALRGQVLWGTCASCHGASGSGDAEIGAPRLNRSNDWYYLVQLDKFKRGTRGGHPDDRTGNLMGSMSLVLSDEQAMDDVVSYIATLR